MDVSPFLHLPLVIQIHAACALLAIVLGPFAILRKRRDRAHKIAGYVWVLAMLTVATTALFIPSFDLALFGHFGPLHGFSVLTFASLWFGMRAVFQGRIAAHQNILSGLYWQGLLLAGMANFLPGRAVNRAVFPNTPDLGYLVIGLGVLALIWFRIVRPWLRHRRASGGALQQA